MEIGRAITAESAIGRHSPRGVHKDAVVPGCWELVPVKGQVEGRAEHPLRINVPFWPVGHGEIQGLAVSKQGLVSRAKP